MKQSSSKCILLSTVIGLFNVLWTTILNTALIIEVMEEIKLCNKKRKGGGGKCSKPSGHIGGCDKKRVIEPFWDNSPILKKQKLSKDLNEGEITKTNLLEDISKAEITQTSLLEDITTAEANKSVLDDAFKKLLDEYKNFKLFIEPKEHSKSPRAKNPPSNETARTTRYNRYIETKEMLKYIHGGSNGAIYGVWE